MNLLEYNKLEHSYQKLSAPKKVKEELSGFLQNVPGFFDLPGSEDASSLRTLVENPPRVHKEIEPLPPSLMMGFKLQMNGSVRRRSVCGWSGQ